MLYMWKISETLIRLSKTFIGGSYYYLKNLNFLYNLVRFYMCCWSCIHIYFFCFLTQVLSKLVSWSLAIMSSQSGVQFPVPLSESVRETQSRLSCNHWSYCNSVICPTCTWPGVTKVGASFLHSIQHLLNSNYYYSLNSKTPLMIRCTITLILGVKETLLH